MAIEETDMPERAVGERAEEADTDAIPRFRSDDFRLRLDSPLFHRDPGMAAAAQAPQLRELTWEHVVRPNAQQQLARTGDGTVVDDRLPAADPTPSELVPGLKPVQLAPVPSIEDLLQRRREAQEQEAAAAAEAAPVDDLAEPEPEPEIEPGSPAVAELPKDDSGAMRRTLPSISSFTSAAEDEPAVDSAPATDPSGPIMFPEAVEQYRAAAESDDEAVEWAALHVIAEDKPEIKPYVQPRIDSLLAALEQMDVAEATHAAAAEQAPTAEPPTVVPMHARERENSGVHRDLLGHLERLDELGDAADVDQVDPEPVPSSATTQTISGSLPVQRPITGSAPAVPQSAVEAELNRLAFLPDQEEPVGPVEVPAIAYSTQPAAPAAGAPALSQHEMYSPRQSAPVVHSRTSFLDLAANSYAPPPRRRKRHVLRNIVTFVILLALVGGGLFAAKYYLLDKRWDGRAKELASEVEQQRELSFDHAIAVTTLSANEYATKIATLALDVTAENTQSLAAEWRALGLLNGTLDLRAIGLNALPDSPAYYDPADETIYVVEGLQPQLYDFAMRRALTLVLLDQAYGWSDRTDDASPAVAHGTRALYDADALATADALTTETDRTLVYQQILALYGTLGIPTSPSPYASIVTGRLGVALVPYLQSVPVANRPAVLRDRLITDGQALDLRRLVAGGVESTAPAARGMLFWYHVLASRVGPDTAWNAALAWRGDDLTSSVTAAGTCVVANIAVDPSALDSTTRAFQQWAEGAPAGAATTVTSAQIATGGQVTVSACDPTTSVASNDGRPRVSLGGAPLRAEQFRLLLIADPTIVPTQAACAVFGGDDITLADDRGVIDAVVGWQAPVNHPAPDPNRLGCAPAA